MYGFHQMFCPIYPERAFPESGLLTSMQIPKNCLGVAFMLQSWEEFLKDNHSYKNCLLQFKAGSANHKLLESSYSTSDTVWNLFQIEVILSNFFSAGHECTVYSENFIGVSTGFVIFFRTRLLQSSHDSHNWIFSQ